MAQIVLDYRSRPKRRRNRNRWRPLGIGAAALFIVAAYWLGRPRPPLLVSSTTPITPVKQIDPLLELEEACRSYRPSGSAPVYIDPYSADDYIRSDPRFIRFRDSDGNITGVNFRMIGDVIYRPIPPWSQYVQAILGPGADRDHALLFLHERCAKGGAPRLVAVELWTGRTFREQIWVSVIDSDRVDRTKDLRRDLCKLHDLIYPLDLFGARAKFFEGEADPSDASHFTIRFTHVETSAILDGWLLSDDHVQLKLRDEKGSDSDPMEKVVTHQPNKRP